LFAADCAERVLIIAGDKRCDAAVLAARRYAFGLIDDVAWAAAKAESAAAWAERAAARAERAAARAERAERAAERDAWAARAERDAWAAWAARDAGDAARAAARDAGAARDARDAARAARAASDAWAAARDAWALIARGAWAAEQKWQTDRLMQYLTGKVNLYAIRRSVTP
jgi:hypothetical protein